MTSFFFFNDTATTEIYTLSLHDALPILPSVRFQEESAERVHFLDEGGRKGRNCFRTVKQPYVNRPGGKCPRQDRKSTRLNSSHSSISYAVFCLKKKKKDKERKTTIKITN